MQKEKRRGRRWSVNQEWPRFPGEVWKGLCHDRVWCGYVLWDRGAMRIAWAFSPEKKLHRDKQMSALNMRACNAPVPCHLPGFSLKAFSGLLMGVITSTESASLCLSEPEAQVFIELPMTSSVSLSNTCCHHHRTPNICPQWWFFLWTYKLLLILHLLSVVPWPTCVVSLFLLVCLFVVLFRESHRM